METGRSKHDDGYATCNNITDPQHPYIQSDEIYVTTDIASTGCPTEVVYNTDADKLADDKDKSERQKESAEIVEAGRVAMLENKTREMHNYYAKNNIINKLIICLDTPIAKQINLTYIPEQHYSKIKDIKTSTGLLVLLFVLFIVLAIVQYTARRKLSKWKTSDTQAPLVMQEPQQQPVWIPPGVGAY